MITKEERIQDKKELINIMQNMASDLKKNAITHWLLAYINASLPLMPFLSYENIKMFLPNMGLAFLFGLLAYQNQVRIPQAKRLAQSYIKQLTELES